MQPDYYYEAVDINVAEDGIYILRTDFEMNPKSYLYEKTFNPIDPFANQINPDFDSGSCPTPYTLVKYLEKQKAYILVVTNAEPNVLGSFSIIVYGSNNVTLKRSGEYNYHVH